MAWLSILSQVLLWVAVLALAFLLLGVFRQIALTNWRLEELAAITPSRVGRGGLKPGITAPDFTLDSIEGKAVRLEDFASRRRLLVFVQPGCGPCSAVVPALNSLQRKGDIQVLVISNGEQEENRVWGEKHKVEFPVLLQDERRLSRRYEVFATPFAFLVDEQGQIAAKGIINNARHIEFLLGSARVGRSPHAASDLGEAEVHSDGKGD
jgi:methylamine dehydrogenase accessory protein MauD